MCNPVSNLCPLVSGVGQFCIDQATHIFQIVAESFQEVDGLITFLGKPVGAVSRWMDLTGHIPNAKIGKPIADIALFKTIADACEAVTKLPTLIQPLQAYTIYTSNTGSVQTAASASYLEALIARIVDVSEWLLGVGDLLSYLENIAFVSLSEKSTRVVSWIASSLGGGVALYGIGKEISRLILATKVDQTTGSVQAMTNGDLAATMLKLASNISYLVMSLLAILAVLGYTLSSAVLIQTVAVSVIASSGMVRHFIEHW